MPRPWDLMPSDIQRRVVAPPLEYATPVEVAREIYDVIGQALSSLPGQVPISQNAVTYGPAVMDSSGVRLFSAGKNTIYLDNDGDAFFGSDLASAATTSLAILNNDQAYNAEELSEGDILLGDNSSGAANLFWDRSGASLSLRSGTTVVQTLTSSTQNFEGSWVFNEAGAADADFRIEGDTATNLFVADAGLDAIQIGTTVAGVIADFRSAAIVFNENAADRDFRIEGDTDANLFFVDAGTDRVGIGTATPEAKWHVNGNFLVQSANGRIWGINGLASGHTVNFQYGGDEWNEIETTYDAQAILRAYHGLIIENFASNQYVIGPALTVTAKTANKGALLVQGATSQTADILVVENIAGTDHLTVQADGDVYMSGNVGIGTTTPDDKFHLTTADGATRLRIENTAADGDPVLHFLLPGIQAWITGIDDSDGDKFKISNVDDAFATAAKLTIDTSGNVGIGTASPGAKLEVAGSGFINSDNSVFVVDDSSGRTGFIKKAGLNTMIAAGSTTPLIFGHSSVANILTTAVTGQTLTENMRIDTAGNVGIGATPDANIILDVVSTTKAFRPPVMTTGQRDLVASPQNGMIIWNSTTGQLEDYNAGWAAV